MPKKTNTRKALPPPDCHYFEAAVGWIELGNCGEALLELDRISAECKEDPQVLELRWQILARMEQWDKSLPVAQEYCRIAPTLAQGWLHQAVSLYRLRRTQEAWDLLVPLAQQFPRSWIIAYDLACYACQLEKVADGRHWLRKAFGLGDATEVKLLALADPDLKVLWPEIEKSSWDISAQEKARTPNSPS